MATITQDLGAVTAYGYAKDAGYTGTEAEFTQLLGDLADTVADLEGLTVSISTLPAGSSATASYSDGVLSLGIPKGDKGDTGNTGATGPAAGFGEVSATVDSSVGTPSVEVSASGPDTAKQFAFAFHNLKGDKGDTGEVSEEDFLKVFPTDTASGSIASFPDGADGVPVKSLVVNIEPVQEGSGDPSPDNVRPISGWTGANVARTGKNIAKLTYGNLVPSVGSGNMVSSNGWASDFTPIDNTQSYTMTNGNGQAYVLFYGVDKNYLGYFQLGVQNYQLSSFTQYSSAYFIKLISDNVQGITPEIQLEHGNATAYEPYNGTTYPVTWTTAGTVYGGTLDVVSGALAVTAEKLTLNGSEGYWSGVATSNGVLRAYTDLSFQNRELLMCDTLKIWTNNTTLNIIRIDSGRLVVTPQWAQSAANINDFKTLLASNNINIVRTLTTPQTYQLTPQQVNSLLGQNNIWANCGDTSVTYRADVAKYIDKKLAAVVAALS